MRSTGAFTRSFRRFIALLALLVPLSTLAACNPSATLVIYNGQHPQLTTAIVNAFEAKTGIQVSVRTNDGVVLANQIIEEGSDSPADVYITENSPELMLLEQRGFLAKLPSSILDEIPSDDNSPDGKWVGVSLRVSCLAYVPTKISRSQLPASILDLAESQWKNKIAIAPTDSDFLPLVGAVAATYGQARALQWLDGLKANAALYQDDESVVAAVNDGQEEVGIINQYYWYRLRLEVGASHMKSAVYYFPNGNIGSLENISGAGMLATSTHKKEAEEFLSFLVSKQGEELISRGDDYEYPARTDVARNSALPPLSSISLAKVSVITLGNDLLASRLIQESGLA